MSNNIGYTEEDLQALKDALVSGTSSVRLGDRQVNFRSVAELKSLIQEVSQALDPQPAASSRTVKASWKKN